MPSRLAIIALAAVAVGAIACRGAAPKDGSQPVATTATPAPADAGAQAAQMAKDVPQAMPQTATAVDFERLVALLPEVNGWSRGKPRGEQIAVGAAMSHAKVEYQRGDASIDLDITDSAFNQLVLSPIAMFLAQGYSERSPEGYAKSAPVGGHPGFEKWNNDSKSGEITVVVGNRFLVKADGRNLETIEPVKALVKSVDLGKLAALR